MTPEQQLQSELDSMAVGHAKSILFGELREISRESLLLNRGAGRCVSKHLERRLRELEQLLTENERLRAACDGALEVIADAITHGMPVTPKVAAVRNSLCCVEIAQSALKGENDEGRTT